MVSRMQHLNFRAFAALTRPLAVAVLAAGMFAAIALPASAAEPDDGSSGMERYDDGRQGGDPQQRDFDGPFEDGTDEPPEAARPDTEDGDQAPGCRFRNGPLELVV